MSLKGKVALVTGAGTGIGLMIAEGFANQGAKVYITGRRGDVLQNAADAYKGPGQLVPLAMDVTKPTDIASSVSRVSEEDGKLNVLVNNAGIPTPPNEPNFTQTKLATIAEGKLPYDLETFEGFEAIFKLNTSAPYFMTTAFFDLLTKGAQAGREGDETSSVINISSVATTFKIAPTPNSFSYSLSKVAVELMTTQLAASFARDKLPIRVNAIAPGVFQTDIFPAEYWAPFKTNPLPGLIEPIPVRRLGMREEMEKAALLLATNGYVNGVVLRLDGGLVLLNP